MFDIYIFICINISKYLSRELPLHCLNLERWQGPPHMNKVKQTGSAVRQTEVTVCLTASFSWQILKAYTMDTVSIVSLPLMSPCATETALKQAVFEMILTITTITAISK